MTEAQRMLAMSTVRTPGRGDISTLTIVKLREPLPLQQVARSIDTWNNDSLYARYHVRLGGNPNVLQSFAKRPHDAPAEWWTNDSDVALATTHAAIDRAMNLPWDLENRPLVRFVLRVKGDSVLEVALVVHHLLADGASHLNFAKNIVSWLVGDQRDLDVDRYGSLVDTILFREMAYRNPDHEYWTKRIKAWRRSHADLLNEPFPRPDDPAVDAKARTVLPLPYADGTLRVPSVRELVHDVYASLKMARINGIITWIAASTRPRDDVDPDFGYFVTMLPMLPPDPRVTDDESLWAEDVRRRFLSPVDTRQEMWDCGMQWEEVYLTYRKGTAHNKSYTIGSNVASFDLLQPYHKPLGAGSIRYAQIEESIDLQTDGVVGSRIFPQLVVLHASRTCS